MKSVVLYSGILLLLLLACNQNSKPANENLNVIDSLAISTITLRVNGMSCEGCETTIKNSLEQLEGVQQAIASHIDSTAIVVFDTTQISIDLISEKISDVGYTVSGEIAVN